jgi:AcrR family transcriptional regulator
MISNKVLHYSQLMSKVVTMLPRFNKQIFRYVALCDRRGNMTPEFTDLRIKRTHALLRDTLIDLIAEKGFDAVTVKDIAERAMVNRATFYRHFQDKYALVTYIFKETIEEVFAEVGAPEQNLKNFAQIFESLSKKPGDLSEPQMQKAIGIMTRMFDHFAKNSKLYKSLLGKNGSSWFSSQMCDYLAGVWRQRAKSSKLLPQKKSAKQYVMPPEMAIACFARWVVSMLTWWLENDMSETPEEMATGCLYFIIHGYYRSLGL